MEHVPFDRSRYALLKEAVDALAGVCDGAQDRDDQGFDGSDTRPGHLYAFLPLEAWPLSAFHRAWRWTKKYRRQLEGMQIDCSNLEAPPLFKEYDRQVAVQPDGIGFFVVFPYDDEVINAFRQIPGSALHKVPIGASDKLFFRYRTVRPVVGAGEALLAFAVRYGFQLGQSVEERAAHCNMPPDIEAPSVQHEYRVELESGGAPAFALYFPRIGSLNEEVKRIPGKSPSYTGPFHWVIPATRRSAEALLDFLELHPQFFVPPDVAEHLRALTIYV